MGAVGSNLTVEQVRVWCSLLIFLRLHYWHLPSVALTFFMRPQMQIDDFRMRAEAFLIKSAPVTNADD